MRLTTVEQRTAKYDRQQYSVNYISGTAGLGKQHCQEPPAPGRPHRTNASAAAIPQRITERALRPR